jgi:5'-deoxynucleotidase
MENAFFAMVSRMRYINRWSLMRNTLAENIEEHSLQVAIIGHALALIRKVYFPTDPEGRQRIPVDPDRVACLCLYHDANEILTGDLPTPVKYFNTSMTGAYRDVERQASIRLLAMLPEELALHYQELLSPAKDSETIREALRLVKAADKISALIKCIEEEKAGNKEFIAAAKKIRKAIDGQNLPEVEYFMEQFLPAFAATLDDLENP